MCSIKLLGFQLKPIVLLSFSNMSLYCEKLYLYLNFNITLLSTCWFYWRTTVYISLNNYDCRTFVKEIYLNEYLLNNRNITRYSCRHFVSTKIPFWKQILTNANILSPFFTFYWWRSFGSIVWRLHFSVGSFWMYL